LSSASDHSTMIDVAEWIDRAAEVRS
jgi:hypothetical protein